MIAQQFPSPFQARQSLGGDNEEVIGSILAALIVGPHMDRIVGGKGKQ